MIKSMKYASRKAIAVMMGEIAASRFEKPDVDILIPIPLHKGSEREYNQTELIARGLSAVWGVPVEKCLRWTIYAPSQASSADRLGRALPAGAMEAVCGAGLRALLVDDVCTTGNTLMAAGIAVTRAGGFVREAVTWSRSV